MKGYNTLKEYIRDYKIYLAARNIDIGKEGETITSLLKKRIHSRLDYSSAKFRVMLKKNNYKKDDLTLIAVHETLGKIEYLEDYFGICFGNGPSPLNYKKILSSRAFKSGKLKKIYDFFPLSIESKKDLFIFLKASNFTKSELNVIMKHICKRGWEKWFNELLVEKRIALRHGRIFA